MLPFVLLGAVVGAIMGVTGAGGGILAVPALSLGMEWPMQQAAPVALLAVGTAALFGAVDGLRLGLVRWRAATLMAVCGIVFAPLGVRLAQSLPTGVLMILFALAMLAASARMLLARGDDADSGMAPRVRNCMIDPATGRFMWTPRCAATLAGMGVLAGTLTGLLGVGGGFVMVPAFRHLTDLRMHGIVATSLAVITLVSLSSAAMALVHTHGHLPPGGLVFVGGAVAGMLTSRVVAKYLPPRGLQVGFAVLAGSVALYLLWNAVSEL